MHKKIFLLIIIIFFCIGWTGSPGANTPICTAGSDQKMPRLVSDGSGGAVVVWEDSRNGNDSDIYAQRIGFDGAVKWASDGIAICTAIGPQRYPRIVSDNSGGFIITWYDRRNHKDYDIYTQRIDRSGKVQWTADGIAVCSAKKDQYDPIPVSDGSGGAVIIWYDRRNGTDYDIYGQRIDSSGNIQWAVGGMAICRMKGNQDKPLPVSDGKGGTVITWQDRRNGKDYDLFAQRVNSSGTPQWAVNGIAVCAAEDDQRNPYLVSDGNEGVIITWQDKRNRKDYDIFSQRLDLSGSVQWTANGVAICTAANSQYDPRLVSDGSGGAVIAWQDYRGGSECSFDAFAQQTDLKSELCEEKQLHDWNVYTQRIDASGKVQWAENGTAVCTAKVDQYKPQLISDGFGGTIITWRAADKQNDQNIYAQRLDSSGIVKWKAVGVAVSTAGGNQFDPLPVSDGKGGAIITWYDKRKGNNSDIYAQKVCVSGEIGGCVPPAAMVDAAAVR